MEVPALPNKERAAGPLCPSGYKMSRTNRSIASALISLGPQGGNMSEKPDVSDMSDAPKSRSSYHPDGKHLVGTAVLESVHDYE
jgi:hypothetical protein